MKCNECSGEVLIEYLESFCTRCGLVVEDNPINFRGEFFESDPEKAARKRRTGAPVTWISPFWETTFNN